METMIACYGFDCATCSEYPRPELSGVLERVPVAHANLEVLRPG